MGRKKPDPSSVGRTSDAQRPESGPRSDEPLDKRIAELALEQWGPISIDQLRELGLSARAVARRCAKGSLHQIHAGVYAVGHPLLTEKGRWMAAVLAGGPGALLSHRDAATHLNLLWPGRHGCIDITVPDRSGRSRPGLCIHRPRNLSHRDQIEKEGIPC